MELVISLPLLIGLFLGSLSLIYYAYASLWINHVLYEGLICLASQGSKFQCMDKARRRIHQGLPLGKLNEIHLIKKLTPFDLLYQGEVNWTLSTLWVYAQKMEIHHKEIYP